MIAMVLIDWCIRDAIATGGPATHAAAHNNAQGSERSCCPGIAASTVGAWLSYCVAVLLVKWKRVVEQPIPSTRATQLHHVTVGIVSDGGTNP